MTRWRSTRGATQLIVTPALPHSSAIVRIIPSIAAFAAAYAALARGRHQGPVTEEMSTIRP